MKMKHCPTLKHGPGENTRLPTVKHGASDNERLQLESTLPQVNMVLITSVETIRLSRDKRSGMGVGKEGDYIPIATLSPPE